MPKLRRIRIECWVDAGVPIAPEIQPQLQQIIFNFALAEDLGGPVCSHVDKQQYLAECAGRLREFILEALQAAKIILTDEELDVLCRRTASEAFIIRRLNEAGFNGELSKREIKATPHYRAYKSYFDQSPDILVQALTLALERAESIRQRSVNN